MSKPSLLIIQDANSAWSKESNLAARVVNSCLVGARLESNFAKSAALRLSPVASSQWRSISRRISRRILKNSRIGRPKNSRVNHPTAPRAIAPSAFRKMPIRDQPSGPVSSGPFFHYYQRRKAHPCRRRQEPSARLSCPRHFGPGFFAPGLRPGASGTIGGRIWPFNRRLSP